MKKYIFALVMALTSGFAFAQEAQNPDALATVMRSNGKIYVVVAVALTVMLGLIVYLFSLDKKITKLEKDLKK